MKYIILSIAFFTLYSCNTGPDNSHIFKVEYKGAMKKIMDGDLSTKANLADFQGKEHLYALGAKTNLKGEILIFDSQPYVSAVKGKRLDMSNSFDHEATLLVYASVAKWKSYDIPADVNSYKEIEKYIKETAEKNGINTGEPFPFLMEGVVRWFDWHIVNWKMGDMEHSHRKHIYSGFNGKMFDQDINILGFYSDSHKGIFTHHTSNTHLHFMMKDGTNAGHVDDIRVEEKVVLKLPDVNGGEH